MTLTGTVSAEKLDKVIVVVLDDRDGQEGSTAAQPVAVYVAFGEPGSNFMTFFQWKHCEVGFADTALKTYTGIYRPCRTLGFRMTQVSQELHIRPNTITHHDIEQYLSLVLAHEHWSNWRYQQTWQAQSSSPVLKGA